MTIEGYKCFNKDQTNRYGLPFEEQKYYHVDGPIQFGNKGNGFHMCMHLSDVFRYFDTTEDTFMVAKVTGFGEMDLREFPDDFEGYFDMYAVSDIFIDHFLTREEIIEIILNSSDADVKKFLRTFYCTKEEIEQFINKFKNNVDVMSVISYYYFDDKEIYYYDTAERKKRLQRLLIKNEV